MSNGIKGDYKSSFMCVMSNGNTGADSILEPAEIEKMYASAMLGRGWNSTEHHNSFILRVPTGDEVDGVILIDAQKCQFMAITKYKAPENKVTQSQSNRIITPGPRRM